MDGSDTRYCSGEAIRVGDRVRCAAWTGRVAFVLGTGSFADGYGPQAWSHLGRGFAVEYDQAGLVFSERAGVDLMLVSRAEPPKG